MGISREFSLFSQGRKNILAIADHLTLKEMNTVPAPFRNNVIWNLGHVIVTQQLLCYKLADLKLNIEDELIGKYQNGTAPAEAVSIDDFKELRELSIYTATKLQTDYQNGLWNETEFKPYKTAFGNEVKSIEDAIAFNNIHEGIHLGYVLNLRKMLQEIAL